MKINILFLSYCLMILPVLSTGQNITGILGRPTDKSVTISFLSGQPVEVYWEYGTVSGTYPLQSGIFLAVPDSALNFVFPNLNEDTKYYYRSRYRASGSTGPFLEGAEHSFHTRRHSGSTFTFAVEADPHLDTNSLSAAYSLTLQNILDREPDFLLDLGDNFMSEKIKNPDSAAIVARHLLYRGYFGSVCHSVPLFLVLGNHEGEQGWALDGTSSSLPVMASRIRKSFYPNPVPDDFYSGNTIPEPFVGLRQNYYSWEWGNCLFIVLDPYWYTTQKPGWGWTLGNTQYMWLKNLLYTSTAKFKFIFCHQLDGGNGNDGRGGVEFAGYFEMGGYNSDSTWGFDLHRPGWGKPLHQMMVDTRTNIYFHGHDHCYARQDKDGIIYQEVPQPSARNISNMVGTQYGYRQGILMPNRGFLLVTVTDSTAKVDYIRTFLPNEETGGHTNGEIAFSYTLTSSAAGIDESQEQAFRFDQNYPNPFRDKTKLTYNVISSTRVVIKIVDPFGRKIVTLRDQYQTPGNYTLEVSCDQFPSGPGIYFCNLTRGDVQQTIKMVLIR